MSSLARARRVGDDVVGEHAARQVEREHHLARLVDSVCSAISPHCGRASASSASAAPSREADAARRGAGVAAGRVGQPAAVGPAGGGCWRSAAPSPAPRGGGRATSATARRNEARRRMRPVMRTLRGRCRLDASVVADGAAADADAAAPRRATIAEREAADSAGPATRPRRRTPATLSVDLASNSILRSRSMAAKAASTVSESVARK